MQEVGIKPPSPPSISFTTHLTMNFARSLCLRFLESMLFRVGGINHLTDYELNRYLDGALKAAQRLEAVAPQLSSALPSWGKRVKLAPELVELVDDWLPTETLAGLVTATGWSLSRNTFADAGGGDHAYAFVRCAVYQAGVLYDHGFDDISFYSFDYSSSIHIKVRSMNIWPGRLLKLTLLIISSWMVLLSTFKILTTFEER